jgi:hypothetical protein
MYIARDKCENRRINNTNGINLPIKNLYSLIIAKIIAKLGLIGKIDKLTGKNLTY